MLYIFRKLYTPLLAVLLLVGMMLPAQAASYKTYTYSYDGKEVLSPDAYEPVKVIDFLSAECGALTQPQDVFVAPSGNVYLADTGNNRIVVLDALLNYQRSITEYTDQEGKKQVFSAPTGLFVTEDDLLYIADSGNSQILVLDGDNKLVQRIGEPKGNGILEDFIFQPDSLVVDKRKRCYVISLHNTSGVMTFAADGEFTGFIGAQNTSPSVTDLFWRLFMTKEQRERSKRSIPAEYSNITMDAEGFFYVTDATLDQGQIQSLVNSRSTNALYSPIKKLNATGTDVMTRTGFFPPVGDVRIPYGTGDNFGGSQMKDVAVCSNGLFSLLDAKRNKIFTYDAEGNLLYAFAGTGRNKGQFHTLISLAYQGNSLLGLDMQTGSLTVFELTEYGQLINDAIALYSKNDFDGAAKKWREVAVYNNNLDMAYIELGNNLYNDGKYLKAMTYYQSASNITKYSKAFGKYREYWMENYFLVIPLVLVMVVFVLLKVAAVIRKKNLAGDFGAKQNLGTRLMYAQRVIFHPFDSFYQIKRHDRGNLLSATVLLALAVLMHLIYNLFSGYIFRFSLMGNFSLVTGVSTVLLPLILFVVSNWCFTCLMNGEGKFKEIYITACYSLTPLIILYPIATVMSNVLLAEEAAFVNLILTIALGWTIFLLFLGMLTIHNYSLGANLATCLLTLLGMLIILFMAVLFVGLIQRMFVFFLNIYNEVAFR